MQPNQFFTALSHQDRLRAVMLLHAGGELCVCQLTDVLGVAQPAVSRHLGCLRDAGIVESRRQGLWIYYKINPGLPGWAREVIEGTAKGIGRSEPFAADRAALAGTAVPAGGAEDCAC